MYNLEFEIVPFYTKNSGTNLEQQFSTCLQNYWPGPQTLHVIIVIGREHYGTVLRGQFTALRKTARPPQICGNWPQLGVKSMSTLLTSMKYNCYKNNCLATKYKEHVII